jgi:hypothetical protein
LRLDMTPCKGVITLSDPQVYTYIKLFMEDGQYITMSCKHWLIKQ